MTLWLTCFRLRENTCLSRTRFHQGHFTMPSEQKCTSASHILVKGNNLRWTWILTQTGWVVHKPGIQRKNTEAAASQMAPYSTYSALPLTREPNRPWSKVVHCIGTRVPFGTGWLSGEEGQRQAPEQAHFPLLLESRPPSRGQSR